MQSPPFGNNRLQQIILKIGNLPTIQKKISYSFLQTFVAMIAKIIAVQKKCLHTFRAPIFQMQANPPAC
jgi:hypothetical protein